MPFNRKDWRKVNSQSIFSLTTASQFLHDNVIPPLNTDIDTLAAALEVENYSPTVANHLAFEADARTVRTQAATILATPALLPTVHRTAYKVMLNDFITVANLLQPGPGYGTTPQDDTAWYAALSASNVTVA